MFQDGRDILDVGIETYLGREQVSSLAQPGERRGEDLVAGGPQQGSDLFPAPAAMPCPWTSTNVAGLSIAAPSSGISDLRICVRTQKINGLVR